MPALAKVLLYGLGEVFPIENIYSATKIGIVITPNNFVLHGMPVWGPALRGEPRICNGSLPIIRDFAPVLTLIVDMLNWHKVELTSA